jgi:hypothetical protein
MADVLDFLFGGKPPTSVTTFGETTASTPKWYNDYTQGMIAKANAVAAEPFRLYTGPRIADFTTDQLNSFKAAQSAAGSYKPFLDASTGSLDMAGSYSGTAAAQPYFNAASMTVPQGISSYMNPYTNQVVDRIGALAKRQMSENIIPTIQNQFIGSGQFGGSRSGLELGKKMRDLQESTTAAQAQALQTGYGQATQAFQADAQRLGQLGQTAGTLANQDLARQMQISQQYADLGKQAQAMGLTEAATLGDIGSQEQAMRQRGLDMAYQDFIEQRDKPQNMISFLNSAIRGLDIPKTTTTSATGPAQTYQPSLISQLAQAGLAYSGLKKLGS